MHLSDHQLFWSLQTNIICTCLYHTRYMTTVKRPYCLFSHLVLYINNKQYLLMQNNIISIDINCMKSTHFLRTTKEYWVPNSPPPSLRFYRSTTYFYNECVTVFTIISSLYIEIQKWNERSPYSDSFQNHQELNIEFQN